MDRSACFKRKRPPKESGNRNLHNAGGAGGDAVLREDQDGSTGLADIEGRIRVYSGKSAFFGCKEEGEALAVGTVCNICLYSVVADVHPVLTQQILQGNVSVIRQIQIIAESLLLGAHPALGKVYHKGDGGFALAFDLIVDDNIHLAAAPLLFGAAPVAKKAS